MNRLGYAAECPLCYTTREGVYARTEEAPDELVCRDHPGHPLNPRHEIGAETQPTGGPTVPSVDACSCGNPYVLSTVTDGGWLFVCTAGHSKTFTDQEVGA